MERLRRGTRPSADARSGFSLCLKEAFFDEEEEQGKAETTENCEMGSGFDDIEGFDCAGEWRNWFREKPKPRAEAMSAEDRVCYMISFVTLHRFLGCFIKFNLLGLDCLRDKPK